MAVIEKTINLKVDSKDAQKNIDKFNEGIKDTGEAAKKARSEVKDVGDSSAKAGKSGKKGFTLLGKGIKGIGVAIKAAGIGILLSILGAVFEVMKKNQKVLDAIETVTNLVAVGFKSVTDALMSAYDSVKDATGGFDALGKVVDGLITLSLTPMKLAFYGLKSALEALKVGYETVFGDEESIKKAKENLAKTKSDIEDVTKAAIQAGIDVATNISEAVGEVATITSAVVENISNIDPNKLLETASAMTQLKNAAEVAAVVQAGMVEEYDRLAEKQRQIRDDESLSVEERKKANDELGIILAKQEKAMLAQADAQIASAAAQHKVNGNQENYLALLEAENNRKAVLAQTNGLLSEQKVNSVALQKESIELTNSESEAESNLSIDRQRFNAEQIDDELLKLEALKQIDLLYSEKEAERLQAIVDNANAETQAKIDAQIALDEFTESSRQLKIENQTAIDELEIERKQKTADDEIAIAKALADSKKAIQDGVLDVVSKGIGVAKDLAGKNKAVQKALLIAENAAGIAKILINTAAANASAVATSPITGGMPWVAINSVSAALGIAGAVSATAKGLQALGGGGSGSKPNIPKGGGGGGAAPAPPSFNVVGASETSALGDAVAGQTNEPVQAYVVSNDVTTAQSLQNNIVDGATI